jgi:archaellum component FlaF (FlaF/FlaG flagellin family)
MTLKMNKQTMVLAAIALVVLLLLYSYWKSRPKVLDASNDKAMSDLFDKLNPGLAPASSPAAQSAAQAVASNLLNTGILGPNMFPILVGGRDGYIS